MRSGQRYRRASIHNQEHGKKETILADKNDVAKTFHENICTETKKVKAEGTITEKDGKKTIVLTKIELAE